MNPDAWDLLSSWLTTWLAADTADRTRLRATLATKHPELVEDADRLTDASRELDGFLSVPALVVAARDITVDDSLLPPGSWLGRYRIEALLARGGMGEVYRALDTRLGRPVALKVLSERIVHDPRRVDRFLREARVTAGLDHPNIVRVLDAGLEGGHPFLVAELLEGETLRSRLDRGPIAPGKVCQLAIEIASALGSAHAAGLVHRDLKPENVFLTTTAGSKLLDFGIAKLTQDESVKDGLSTLTGVVIGTAGYLSPEQVRGAAVDARADLFALGTLLHEMLTGQRAFGRPNVVETLHAVLHDAPGGSLAMECDVPPELTDLVMRLLEKAPEQRPASAAEVVLALTAIDTPVAAPEPAARRRSAPPAGRPGQVTLAVMPFRSIPAGSTGALMELGLADVFVSRLSQLPELQVLPLSATERVHDDDPRRAAQRLGANRVLIVTLQRDGAVLRASVQLVSVSDGRVVWATTVDTDATSAFVIQDIIVTRVIEELAPSVAPVDRRRVASPGTRSSAAFEAYLKARLHAGRPTPLDLRTAAGLFRRAVELDPSYADAWAGLGSALKRLPVVALEEPNALLSAARAAAGRALTLDPDHAEAHSVLGTVAFWLDWDYAEAERHLRHALALQPGSADAQLFLAHVLSNTGRADEALDEIRRARALDPAWLPPRTLEGQFLCMARRFEEALSCLDAVVQIDPRFWNAHLFRAYALAGLGRCEDVVNACDRAMDARRAFDPPGEPYAVALARKAAALAQLGRRREAEALLDDIHGRSMWTYVPPHAEAVILQALGRDTEALDRLEDAVRMRDVFVTFLAVDVVWDSLRDSSGFRSLLARTNLRRTITGGSS